MVWTINPIHAFPGRRRAEDSVPLLYAISPCRPAGGPHGLLLVYGGQARIYAQNHKKAIPKALVWTSPAARALCRQAAGRGRRIAAARQCSQSERVYSPTPSVPASPTPALGKQAGTRVFPPVFAYKVCLEGACPRKHDSITRHQFLSFLSDEFPFIYNLNQGSAIRRRPGFSSGIFESVFKGRPRPVYSAAGPSSSSPSSRAAAWASGSLVTALSRR